MAYEADVPNFLEPWYGIGVIGAAFGLDYIWNPGQAPAVKPAFQTIDEALAFDYKPVKETTVGKHSLAMIEYFLDQTKGKVPMSMGDIQSPFNNATYVVDTSNFLISMIMEPEKVLAFLDLLADLEIDFYREQERLIGDALVRPGHGFASSPVFEGFGMSDDNVVMVDEESYMNYVSPSFVKLGKAFGGPVHHSCGNFSDKAKMLLKLDGLKMADAAFTAETDPAPNPAAPFRTSYAGQINPQITSQPTDARRSGNRGVGLGRNLLDDGHRFFAPRRHARSRARFSGRRGRFSRFVGGFRFRRSSRVPQGHQRRPDGYAHLEQGLAFRNVVAFLDQDADNHAGFRAFSQLG